MKNGTLYCVSTGPGDPELMTLKAVRITKECPVLALSVDATRRDRESMEAGDEKSLKKNCIAYRIASGAVDGLEKKECLYLSMPMSKDKELVKKCHEEAMEQVIACLKQGKSVAWLTLGDATVYASSMYVAQMVKEQGFDIQVISGVTSFCAAAARLGKSLVSGREELHVIPSSYHIEDALSYSGTKVLMKAGSRMGDVKTLLKQKNMEASGVEYCGMEQEKLYENTEQLDENAGYYTVLIVASKNDSY